MDKEDALNQFSVSLQKTNGNQPVQEVGHHVIMIKSMYQIHLLSLGITKLVQQLNTGKTYSDFHQLLEIIIIVKIELHHYLFSQKQELDSI